MWFPTRNAVREECVLRNVTLPLRFPPTCIVNMLTMSIGDENYLDPLGYGPVGLTMTRRVVHFQH